MQGEGFAGSGLHPSPGSGVPLEGNLGTGDSRQLRREKEGGWGIQQGKAGHGRGHGGRGRKEEKRTEKKERDVGGGERGEGGREDEKQTKSKKKPISDGENREKMKERERVGRHSQTQQKKGGAEQREPLLWRPGPGGTAVFPSSRVPKVPSPLQAAARAWAGAWLSLLGLPSPLAVAVQGQKPPVPPLSLPFLPLPLPRLCSLLRALSLGVGGFSALEPDRSPLLTGRPSP